MLGDKTFNSRRQIPKVIAIVVTWRPSSSRLSFDIIAILERFKSLPSAPSKVRVDLEPATPDRLINITDITSGLDAFRGTSYPFPPFSAPCP